MNSTNDAVAAEAAEKLIASVEALLEAASGSQVAIPVDLLEGVRARVQSARIGFPFVIEERSCHQIDRLGSVLLGPVFTSQSYPWPKDPTGRPMAPLCQLNAVQFPQRIVGVDGLVQVWLRPSGDEQHGETLIRMIPEAEALADQMTPVIAQEGEFDVLLPEAADWLGDFHAPPKPTKAQYLSEAAARLGFANADEMSDADWSTWSQLGDEYADKFGNDVIACMQITGFEEARLYCDITHDQKSAVNTLDKLRRKLEKTARDSDKALIPLLANTCRAFDQWLKCCGDLAYPCLLGTFQEIQYRAADKDDPFICFESLGLREWGDGGNAQVFFSERHGFSFEWSCS
jgi:hypothetical protein